MTEYASDSVVTESEIARPTYCILIMSTRMVLPAIILRLSMLMNSSGFQLPVELVVNLNPLSPPHSLIGASLSESHINGTAAQILY